MDRLEKIFSFIINRNIIEFLMLIYFYLIVGAITQQNIELPFPDYIYIIGYVIIAIMVTMVLKYIRTINKNGSTDEKV